MLVCLGLSCELWHVPSSLNMLSACPPTSVKQHCWAWATEIASESERERERWTETERERQNTEIENPVAGPERVGR